MPVLGRRGINGKICSLDSWRTPWAAQRSRIHTDYCCVYVTLMLASSHTWSGEIRNRTTDRFSNLRLNVCIYISPLILMPRTFGFTATEREATGRDKNVNTNVTYSFHFACHRCDTLQPRCKITVLDSFAVRYGSLGEPCNQMMMPWMLFCFYFIQSILIRIPARQKRS